MPLVEYVGRKAKKTDNVAGTGTVWNGPGDVQMVPDAAWPKMVKHTDVWKLKEAATLATAAPAPSPTPTPAPAPTQPAGDGEQPKFFLKDGDGAVINLDAMDDEALRALVETLRQQFPKIKVHAQVKGDKLRGAIVEQVNAAAAGDGEA